MLPGIDGLACLQRIQDKAVLAAPPRVVIVTALNDAGKRAEALNNGAEDYVLKPDLFERLPELLRPHNWANGQQPLKCMKQKRS